MKQKYRFYVTIDKVIEYDDSEETKKMYGGLEFIEDMVEMDKRSADEDPIMFFIEWDSNWSEVKVERIDKL